MLSDEKETQKLTGEFVYSTQQLFLFYLYSEKKRLYTSEAGKVLPFTAMTLTRAVKQLETALSEKTMLNPSRVVTYAISEKNYDKALLMIFHLFYLLKIQMMKELKKQ